MILGHHHWQPFKCSLKLEIFHDIMVDVQRCRAQEMDSKATLSEHFQKGHQDLPALLRALPVDGEIWRRRGSMKGVKEEEDLCFGTVGVCEKSMSREWEKLNDHKEVHFTRKVQHNMNLKWKYLCNKACKTATFKHKDEKHGLDGGWW